MLGLVAMVPAWSLLLALLAGGVAGWFLHSRLARRPSPVRPVTPAEAPIAAAAEPEPEKKMEAVLTELERRYQGRVADDAPPRPRARRRKRSGTPEEEVADHHPGD